MIVLKISNLTYSYNDKVLFDNINLSLIFGQKVALIGQNGSGKTTLFDLIYGNISNTESVSPSILDSNASKFNILTTGSVEYVTQNLDFRPDATVLEYLIEQSLDWFKIWEILEVKFGFENTLEVKLSRLSHGEYLKLRLAISIFKNPDLLLLDEPTNNLDQDSIIVLGRLLVEFSGTILVVSHDPAFLDFFTSEVLELSSGKIELYGGNYRFYSQQKQLQEQKQNELYNLAKRELKRAYKSQKESIINAEHRLIKGKKDASKSNLGKAEQNFFKNKSEVKSGQNKNKFDRIISQKEEDLLQNTPNSSFPIHFKFDNNKIKNKRLLEIKKSELIINHTVLLQEISFEVYSGQKILILGKNGSGKSSFLKGLVGYAIDKNEFNISNIELINKLEPNYFAKDLEVIYLDQNYSLVDKSKTIERNIYLADPQISDTDLYKLLAYFRFAKESLFRLVNTLSGGELVRLNLAILTLKKIDVLILDEPTNNLDISTLEVLLKVLKEFKGALVLVSHNAWFNKQIEFDQIYQISEKLLKSIKKDGLD